MGLDIYAVTNPVEVTENGEEARKFFTHGGDWADREEGVPAGYFEWKSVDYACASYGGYYAMRLEICKAVFGLDVFKIDAAEVARRDDWLLRLCVYSDCEGTFGPEPVKKIAARLREVLDNGIAINASVVFRWRQWLSVFESAAAGNGVVVYR